MRDLALKIPMALLLAAILAACAPDAPTPAREDSVSVTVEDYRRAESFLSANTSSLLNNNIVAQYWQDDGRLVYRLNNLGVPDYRLVDPATGSNSELLDRSRLLEAFSDISKAIDSEDLLLGNIELQADASLQFRFAGNSYSLDFDSYQLEQLEDSPPNEVISPDGSKAAFIDSYNLWLRDTSSNELTQLTFDGVENYGYATDNAGWLRRARPVLNWSPDSSKIATFRHDGRNVGDMYLWETKVGHPKLDAWKYPLPGDEHIFMIERIVIHLEAEPRTVRLDMPPDPHRSTTSDHVAGADGRFLDVQWSGDSQTLAFVSSSRDHKIAELRLADAESGAVRDVYREEVETHFMSGVVGDENWRVLHDSNEFLWFSEKDDWGHLYLHDLATGELKQQLTSGPWLVLDVLQLDQENRQVYFLASNIEGSDPYYHYLYRINLDGSDLELLTPETAHHQIRWSESGAWFTDTYSTPVEPGQTVIRDRDGEILVTLDQIDVSALLASGWPAPEPFSVTARDRTTALHGLMYKPSNFDASRSYPVLNYLYPGPLGSSVGSRAFRPSRGDKQAVAELGFIVVEVDAMGTPGRSKSFQDVYYGNMGDNGLPDQISTLQQLAETRPWMDLDRVGIWGHSGGGFASTAAILRYPDFYKVAVSSAGNHDNRNYEDDWGERFQGLLETYPESNPTADGAGSSASSTSYDNQANQLLVENLKGKLLLAHGTGDTNVHPSSTLLVVDALIKAEKDFDLFMFPNRNHGFANQRYFMNKRWDYFVEHLIGAEPPSDFQFAENIP